MKPQPIGRCTLTPSYEDLQAEIARLRDALDEQTGRAAWHYECLTKCEETVIQRGAEIERLRLTDAEREALGYEVELAEYQQRHDLVATLRGLLSRTGDYPASDNAADRDSGTTGSV